MKQDSERQFLDAVRTQLDSHADALDAQGVARLQAARRRALQQARSQPRRWLPLAGLATAAAALLAVLVWQQVAVESDVLPGDWDALATSEELELIDELEFYAWLEDIEASS